MKGENIQLIVKTLTPDNFARFGDVISISDNVKHFSINSGHTERYHDLAHIDVSSENGHTLVNIFRSNPLAFPIALHMMERHPLGSQAFMPLNNQPYLVVVAPAGSFDLSLIEVFLASAEQGVNYHKGTWHHFCLALNQVSDFLVIDRGGPGDNCDVEKLDGSLIISSATVKA